MIKGLTAVTEITSPEAFGRLRELFEALGFEPGRGWKDAGGEGAAFLAPLGNLELVTGRPPAVPRLLVEVSGLDAVYATVQRWCESAKVSQPVSEPAATHWNSRMFRVALGEGVEVGFWESENPMHGRPLAVEGDLSAAGKRFAVVVARWNAVITDRLLQGTLDALYRSGCAKADIEIVRVPGCLGDTVSGENARGIGNVFTPSSPLVYCFAERLLTMRPSITRLHAGSGSRSRKPVCRTRLAS